MMGGKKGKEEQKWRGGKEEEDEQGGKSRRSKKSKKSEGKKKRNEIGEKNKPVRRFELVNCQSSVHALSKRATRVFTML